MDILQLTAKIYSSWTPT